MAEIFTTKGMMDEALLDYHEEITDNDHEYTVVKVWTLNGEIMKRLPLVGLKKGLSMTTEAGGFA